MLPPLNPFFDKCNLDILTLALTDNLYHGTKDKVFPKGIHMLTLSQTTNFKLFQTERVCRQQILIQ